MAAADFLVAKRAFRAWLRGTKKTRGEKRKIELK